MTYQEKGDYIFNRYQQALLLNVLFALLFIGLDLGEKNNLIIATVFIISSITIYFIHKTLGFFTVSVAIGSAIAAIYQYLNIGLTFTQGEGQLAIAPVILLLLIIELLYVLVKIIIIENGHKNLGIFFALVFTISMSVLSYYLEIAYPVYFTGILYITLFFMGIFFSSMVSILYMKGTWTPERLVMVSYVVIFVYIIGAVLSIVLEEDSFLELLIPDEWMERKKKKG